MESLAFTEVVRMVCEEYGLPLAPDKPESIEETELMKRWAMAHCLKRGADINKVIMKVAAAMRLDNDGPFTDQPRYDRILKEQRAKEQQQTKKENNDNTTPKR
jgi:hypothetical protein